MVEHERAHRIHLFDQLTFNDGLRRADPHHFSLRQGEKAVAILAGDIQIVQHSDDSQTAFLLPFPDVVHHLDLVTDIQLRRRFVQQQPARLLRHHLGERYPLPLTSAQFIERS